MSPWEPELCSDLKSAALDWLWPNYLPRGKLVLLDGDPGMGKSLLTIDLVARLSQANPLADGTLVTRPSTSILFSVEDDAADTMRPRAEAAGADLSRVVIPKFGDRVPRFPEHIPALEDLIRTCSADLVVIDPLMAFLPPSVAANLDQLVRQALSPLAVVAGRTNCTILLVRHLTKKNHGRVLTRGQGSMGIIAAVRMSLLVERHPDREDQRVLAVVKSNCAAVPPALGFRIVESPSGTAKIEWTGTTDLSASDLFQKKVETRVKACDRAIDWLKRELANGPRKVADLFASAAETGIPERTLRRAKPDVHARSHRTWDYDTERGDWYWYDPDAPWPTDAPFKKPHELPPLEPL